MSSIETSIIDYINSIMKEKWLDDPFEWDITYRWNYGIPEKTLIELSDIEIKVNIKYGDLIPFYIAKELNIILKYWLISINEFVIIQKDKILLYRMSTNFLRTSFEESLKKIYINTYIGR